jgi:glucose-6-phosphate isomerase
MAAKQWKSIESHAVRSLDALFTAEPDRLSKLSFDVAGIYFDWSKTHLDAELLKAFAALSEAKGFAAAREALFAGGIVNPSEGQAAEHVAERGNGAPDAVDLATARRGRMRALIDAIEAGAFGDVTGVLHIGIGGSVLGPALLVDALGRTRAGYKVRFLSNIDGEAFDEAVADLDPATTLVVVASKTFTTTETLANMAAALALGWDAFEELLEGGAEMDRHFRFAEAAGNVPLIAAFADRLYVRKMGCQTRGVFAYDERLRLLPSYLQQLEMESNGKSVTADGKPVGQDTAPVTWGGTGTDAQHAVFQLLHQGTVLVPLEFVAVSEGEDSLDPEHHRLLLLNAFAQGAALMQGRESDDAQRSYAGNRPSATVLLERLDARSLGALIAFYEHRTFANAVLLGTNPFDQFGVELGKDIARELGEGADNADLDPSTRALIDRAGV